MRTFWCQDLAGETLWFGFGLPRGVETDFVEVLLGRLAGWRGRVVDHALDVVYTMYLVDPALARGQVQFVVQLAVQQTVTGHVGEHAQGLVFWFEIQRS